MIITLVPYLSMLARAGGGGSSSGGDGDGMSFFVVVGFGASYGLGLVVKKLLPRKAELIVSATFAVVASIILLALGLMISGLGFWIMVQVIIGIWIGWTSAFFGVWEKLRQKAAKTKTQLAISAQVDPAWDIESLKRHVEQTFYSYQQDWSNFNLQNITTYTTVDQAKRTGLLLRVLQEMHRSNRLESVSVKQLEIIEAVDAADNNADIFTAAIEAVAQDTLIDTRTNTALFADNNAFTEFWTFKRQDNSWLLSTIDQATASARQLDDSLRTFAQANNMYYSPDMGWLLLPNSGVLFSGGAFGTSDINNHVVGLYNEHVVQLYSYRSMPRTTGVGMQGFQRQNNFPTAIVAQINLPKSYEGILVRRKTGFFTVNQTPKPPKNYQQFTFEWPDFNKRYTVHATSQDRLAAFELINPSFMAYLYDTDSSVSIEVADNVVYLYKYVDESLRQNKLAHYQQFMEILNRAFKELQL